MSEISGVPEPVEPQTSGEIRANEAASAWERLRGRLRIVYGILLLVALTADVVVYSLYEAEHARVNALDHRLERVDKILVDLVTATDNAEKIEKIEQKVAGMESRVTDLATHLKAEVQEPAPEPKPKNKR